MCWFQGQLGLHNILKSIPNILSIFLNNFLEWDLLLCRVDYDFPCILIYNFLLFLIPSFNETNYFSLVKLYSFIIFIGSDFYWNILAVEAVLRETRISKLTLLSRLKSCIPSEHLRHLENWITSFLIFVCLSFIFNLNFFLVRTFTVWLTTTCKNNTSNCG